MTQNDSEPVQVSIGARTWRRVRTRVTKAVEPGTEAAVRYNSAYGGEQLVTGDVTAKTNYRGSREALIVDDRKLARGNRVTSAADDRRVGEVERVTVIMDLDDAIDAIVGHADGYDLDRGDDRHYIQYWDGPTDDLWAGTVYLTPVEDGELDADAEADRLLRATEGNEQ